MKVDNVKSQMRKGMLEYCIMLLLHKEPSYASDIIQKLKEAQLIVVEGTLYPLLIRRMNHADTFPFNNRRKMYSIFRRYMSSHVFRARIAAVFYSRKQSSVSKKYTRNLV